MLKRNFILHLLPFLFTTILISCENPECGIAFSIKEEHYVLEGERLQRSRNFDQAITEYDKAIKVNELNYLALSNRASCMFEKYGLKMPKDSLAVCLDLLEDAIETCPEFKASYTNIITITSDFQVSLMCLHYGELYNNKFDTDCHIEAKIAKAYLNMVDTANTRSIIEAQQDVRCDYGGLPVTTAKYYQVVRDTLRSEQILLNLIKREPYNSFALTELGKLFKNKRSFLRAKSTFEEALLYDKDNFEARYELSQIYFSQDSLTLGCNHLDLAISNGNEGLYSILYRDTLSRLYNKFCLD